MPTWHEDFRNDLSKIDVPTLVIHGDADRILPITASGLRTAKLIKGARLVVVKDGPHCITWTHAQEVNSELVNFLGKGAAHVQSQRTSAKQLRKRAVLGNLFHSGAVSGRHPNLNFEFGWGLGRLGRIKGAGSLWGQLETTSGEAWRPGIVIRQLTRKTIGKKCQCPRRRSHSNIPPFGTANRGNE